MPIIRKKLQQSDVYPDDIRYDADTDKVQSKINGTWTDNPAADPRTQTLFPPRLTSDPACDAAESVKDAFKGQIDSVLSLISGASSAFTVAGAILALFEFGPFGVFIVVALALAHAMIDAGATAITAAMTPAAYETFKCILKCHMDASGRVNPGELGLIQSDVTEQIGGLAATILNSMLSLAGEGGINNLASLGTSTGDCSDCDCGDCDLTGWLNIFVGEETRFISPGVIEIVASTGHGDAQYYAGIFAPTDSDNCMCFDNPNVVSGAITGAGTPRSWSECGEGVVATHGSVFTASGATCYRTLYYASTVPFTVRFKCKVVDCDCE